MKCQQIYWINFKHHMISVELSEAQTTALVERCRKDKVTVNTAITSAFVGAQYLLLGSKANPNIMIAASVRDRLPKPAGEAVGFFASGVVLEYKYDQKMSFWENSRKLHKLTPLYNTKNLFKRPLNWLTLNPAL